jgi:hypothetical protein
MHFTTIFYRLEEQTFLEFVKLQVVHISVQRTIFTIFYYTVAFNISVKNEIVVLCYVIYGLPVQLIYQVTFSGFQFINYYLSHSLLLIAV